MKYLFTLLTLLLSSPILAKPTLTPESLTTLFNIENLGTIEEGAWLLYATTSSEKGQGGLYTFVTEYKTQNLRTGSIYTLPKECDTYVWNQANQDIIGVCKGEAHEVWRFSRKGEKQNKLLSIDESYQLNSVSPNGNYILLSKTSRLYDVDYYSILQDRFTWGVEYYLATLDKSQNNYSAPQKIELGFISDPPPDWNHSSDLLFPIMASSAPSYKSRKPVQMIKYNPVDKSITPFESPPSIVHAAYLSEDGNKVLLSSNPYGVQADNFTKMLNFTTVINKDGAEAKSQMFQVCLGWMDPEHYLATWVDHQQQKLGFFDISGQLVEPIPVDSLNLGGIKKVKIESPNTVTFVASQFDSAEEIYSYTRTNKSLKRLTNVQPLEFTKTRYDTISWTSFDDKQIEGLLLYPKDYSPSTSYPLLVGLHGGPPGSFFKVFSPLWRLFVENGYFVFLPNVRGSTGFGYDYAKSVVDHVGDADIQDVLTGVESLANQGIIDKTRMSIQGGSYGGYLTLQMVTLTDVFRSALSLFGMSFYPTAAALSDYEAVPTIYLGMPDKNWKLWLERSPLLRANQIETPVMLIHGNYDDRVSFLESSMMAYALAKHNKPVDGFVALKGTHFRFTANGEYLRNKAMLDFHMKWNPPNASIH